MSDRVTILGLDTITMDYFFEVTPDQKLINFIRETLREIGTWPDGKDKGTIEEAGTYTFLNRMVQHEDLFPKAANSAGGSAPNTLTTVERGVRDTEHEVDIIFCSTVSTLPSGMRIREQMKSYKNVTIYPDLPEEQQEKVISPSSYIFIEDGKLLAKARGLGNKEFITSTHIKEIFASKKIHMLFIPGTAIEKFDPRVAYTAVDEAAKHGSDIVFAMPTEFTEQNRIFSGHVIDNHATVILSNMEELCEYYNLRNNSNDNVKIALGHLARTLNKRADKHPSAFISDGKSGAWIVTPNNAPIHIPLWNGNTKIKDMTGAGDNFNAGAIIGLLLGYDQPKSIHVAGHIGAAMSDTVIQQIGAQLHTREPKDVLAEVETRLNGQYRTAQSHRSNPPLILDHHGLPARRI